MRQTWVLAVLLAYACLVRAEVSEETDLREEIVLRCHYDMGEFGVEGVRLCIEADNTALTALSAYPNAAKRIVSRCTRQMQTRGWATVQLCVDQDLAARDALAQYPEEQRAVIERCEAQIGQQGPAKVKACADQQIPSNAETEKP